MTSFSERMSRVVPRDRGSMLECIEGILQWGEFKYTVLIEEGQVMGIQRRCGDGELRILNWGTQNADTGEWYLAVRLFSEDEAYLVSMREGSDETEEEMMCKHFQVLGEMII